MASTFAGINQTKVDQNIVQALRSILPMLSAFSVRVAFDAPKVENDVVYVPLSTDPTAGSKTLGTMKTADGGVAGVSVTLANPTAAGWDAVEGKISRDLFPVYWADKITGGVFSCAQAIIDAALGVVTAANFGDSEGVDKLTCAPADFGQSDAALLWQYAEAKIKQRQRSFGMNAAIAGALFGESNLGLMYANSGNNFFQTGVVPNMLGMNSWCYSGFPANSQNLAGAIFGKAAIAVAIAPIDELMAAGQGNIVERRVVTEPDSGISALYTMTAEGGGKVSGEIALLYGVAKGQNAVVRLVTGN